MFQAELHLQQDKSCVVSELAERFDTAFDIEIEELHDHLVTFVIEADDDSDAFYDYLEESSQVKHVERLDAGNYLVTKESCGAYSAVDRNHGILRRRNFISSHRREYTVLFFRREDLRAMIEEFKQIGTVTLDSVTQFNESASNLTDRQYEVIELALGRGYFEWPRRTDSDALASELGISRPTLLEHLRKAQSKLLTEALEGGRSASAETRRRGSERAD